MRSQFKTFIFLGLGITFLGLAIFTGQIDTVISLFESITKSGTAGIPTP